MVNATKKWIFLKASSIILIPLMLWFIINLVSIYEKDYVDIVSFFSYTTFKIFDITFNDYSFLLFFTKYQ